jgi:hypothetical protein
LLLANEKLAASTATRMPALRPFSRIWINNSLREAINPSTYRMDRGRTRCPECRYGQFAGGPGRDHDGPRSVLSDQGEEYAGRVILFDGEELRTCLLHIPTEQVGKPSRPTAPMNRLLRPKSEATRRCWRRRPPRQRRDRERPEAGPHAVIVHMARCKVMDP